MAEPLRVGMTLRLKPEDRDLLVQAAEECGLEGGTAARQVVEAVIKRLRDDRDFLTALLTVRSALENKQPKAA
jgi:hypothetical protein